MKVLQIANDYLNPLFEKMFTAMENQEIDNTVVVPISFDGIQLDSWKENVVVLKCFSKWARFFFYRKQRKIHNSIISGICVNDYQIIHAHTLFSSGYSAMMLKEKYGIPYIVAIRNVDVNVFFKYMIHFRPVGQKIMSEASSIVFLSPAYRDYVINKYILKDLREKIKSKSVVIPNGIAQVFFDNLGEIKTLKKETTLLFVGEITKNKNLDRIIDVLKKRNETRKKTRLVIVGDLIERECKKYLFEPDVEYHTKCSQKELIEFYRMADIFIMPSHTETFGLVYVEAMSQGLPVLYTRGQGFDGYFKDGVVGYAVDDYDTMDIVEKIEKIISNYYTISSNCLKLCRRFNWNAIAERYRDIYGNIIKREEYKDEF